jgi:universal stress protein A
MRTWQGHDLKYGLRNEMGEPYRPQRILVPIDSHRPTAAGLKLASGLAKQTGGEIIIAYVSVEPGHMDELGYAEETPDEIKARVDEAMAGYIKEHTEGVSRVTSALHIGDPATEIISLAEEEKIDLIVIDVPSRSGVKRLLGSSVSERVMRHAPCPVLSTARESGDEED